MDPCGAPRGRRLATEERDSRTRAAHAQHAPLDAHLRIIMLTPFILWWVGEGRRLREIDTHTHTVADTEEEGKMIPVQSEVEECLMKIALTRSFSPSHSSSPSFHEYIFTRNYFLLSPSLSVVVVVVILDKDGVCISTTKLI